MGIVPGKTVPTLATTVDGLKFKNPFVIGSAPPGTNVKVIKRAFKEGWGGVIAKTVSLDCSKVVNVGPRYAKLMANDGKEVIGWENIELISDRKFDIWLDEFKEAKDAYPDGILIASVMEEYHKDAWCEIIERCQDAGVDAFELNFSCPHGLPERKMGAAMGQDPVILEEVCGWVMAVSKIPVWAKMTPNVTHIEEPTAAALRAGCHGVSAINTIRSVMGVNLETLRPEPTVEGCRIVACLLSLASHGQGDRRSARFRRPAEHSSFQRFSFQPVSLIQIPLSPASGPGTRSFNGHTPKVNS